MEKHKFKNKSQKEKERLSAGRAGKQEVGSLKDGKDKKTKRKGEKPSSSPSPKVEGNSSFIKPDATPSMEKSFQELQELQEKSKKQEEDILYLRAEFDNYRRRMAREKEELRELALEPILFRLLEIMDNFERALTVELNPKNWKTYSQGVQMTAQELKATLKHFGLEEVETPLGMAFDPTLHEALGSEENQKFPPGHLSRIYKKAYKLKGKLLRPAQVMVAAPPKEK